MSQGPGFRPKHKFSPGEWVMDITSERVLYVERHGIYPHYWCVPRVYMDMAEEWRPAAHKINRHEVQLRALRPLERLALEDE